MTELENLAPTDTLLKVENLCLGFGSHVAMTDLSFTLSRNETLAFVGESGSGKSATAMALMRLIERDGGAITSGRIVLTGSPDVDLTHLSGKDMRKIRGARIAMIFQEPMTALNPVMRLGDQVMEAIGLHRGLRGDAARAAVLDAFERVHIPMPAQRINQYPHELSGGMRQRVMIAMALACRPDILIADEPTTALDVTTQAEILTLIKELQVETGMGVIFITHDMSVVSQVADRVIVMRHGKVIETDQTKPLFENPREAYTRQLLSAAPRLGGTQPPQLPSNEGQTPLLQVKGLEVRFPVSRGFKKLDYHAVNGVDLTLWPGETLGIVGESGCGKSTLARAISRLIPSTAGEIHLQGQQLHDIDEVDLRPLRRQMQMVFQDPNASLNPRRKVWQLVTEPARLAGQINSDEEARALAASLLQRVSLPHDAIELYPHQFSGGQRQRLCIARALSAKPALIIADEPVSALDVTVARQVTDLLANLQQEEGMACLFISHDLAVVERSCHRVAVMYCGEIVETGPTAKVLNNPQHDYTRRLLAAVPHVGAEPNHQPLPAVARKSLLCAPGTYHRHHGLVGVDDSHFVAQAAA